MNNIKQQGVVLMTALIVLLTLTVIALSLVRLSVVELKVAGASQRYQLLFNDSETILAHYFFNNQQNFVQGCLTNKLTGTTTTFQTSLVNDVCRAMPGLDNSGSVYASTSVGATSSKMFVLTMPNIRMQYSRVELQVEQTACSDRYFSQTNSGQGSDETAQGAVFFNVRARAWDILDNDASVTIHTGLVARTPPGDFCLKN